MGIKYIQTVIVSILWSHCSEGVIYYLKVNSNYLRKIEIKKRCADMLCGNLRLIYRHHSEFFFIELPSLPRKWTKEFIENNTE